MKKGIIIITILAILMFIGMLVKDNDNEFVKSCVNAGYSQQHCESHK